MVTQSGKHTRMSELANLMEMMKAMMEERKQHNEKLVVEHQERDQQLAKERSRCRYNYDWLKR